MFQPDRIVRSRRVVTPSGTIAAAIHIRNGKIIGVVGFDDVIDGCPLDDAGDHAVLPGVVDTHVRASDPRPEISGYDSATRSAAAGGVTTIIDMPFPGRPTTTVAALEAKRAAAARGFVDVGFWGGIVPDNAGDLAPLFEAGVFGFACLLKPSALTSFPHLSAAGLATAMTALARLRALLLVHAELDRPPDGTIADAGRDDRWWQRLRRFPWSTGGYASYLARRPKAMENGAVDLVAELCRTHQARTHIVHLSSSDALTTLYHARAARLPMTVETCPHYLLFAADAMANGSTAFSCEPPIRERENREFLWAALANGLIQTVASDHATAVGQCVTPLRLSLSAVWTEAAPRGYTLNQLAGWMCRTPAQFAGLARKGAIDVGFDADLVVFDPDRDVVVDDTMLEANRHASPYRGRRLRGSVERTYLRGTPIYSRRDGWAATHGQLLARSN